MKITTMHIEALRYVASGDYCRVGMQKPRLSQYVQELKDEGYIIVKSDFNRAKLCLTIPGKSLMKSLTR